MARFHKAHSPSPYECTHISETDHRAHRLEAERERLERRRVWAVRRGDVAKVERLERQLAALMTEMAKPAEARGAEEEARRQWAARR